MHAGFKKKKVGQQKGELEAAAQLSLGKKLGKQISLRKKYSRASVCRGRRIEVLKIGKCARISINLYNLQPRMQKLEDRPRARENGTKFVRLHRLKGPRTTVNTYLDPIAITLYLCASESCFASDRRRKPSESSSIPTLPPRWSSEDMASDESSMLKNVDYGKGRETYRSVDRCKRG